MLAQNKLRITVTASIILPPMLRYTVRLIDGACFKIVSTTQRNGFVPATLARH